MKKLTKIQILGILAAVLAVVVLVAGIYTNNAKTGDGSYATLVNDARAKQAAMNNAEKAGRNANAVSKQADSAVGKIEGAVEDTDAAIAAAAAIDTAIAAGTETGDVDVDVLMIATELIGGGIEAAGAADAESAFTAALGDIAEGAGMLETLTADKILALYQACVDDAYSGVNGAETAIIGVRDGVVKVYELSGLEAPELPEIAVTELPVCSTIEECHAAMEMLSGRAVELQGYRDMLPEWAGLADDAYGVAVARKLTTGEKLAMKLADNFIGIVFTAALLMVIALVMLFLEKPFKAQWAKNHVFSVFIALMAMLVVQTYALGFAHESFAAWGKFWFDNTFNVLRANSSVGIVALGMTMVIITGGIDLAVGSTIAGVGTVLMTMIDTGEHGVLVKFGITGVPAFIIGIVVALAVGVAIGAIIGLMVTKGRIPPFIVTLGMMNVVRSVAQYFTKSYTPTVPKTFEAISNTVVFGQRPMTVVYWLVIAVIIFFIMKNTAFGRHVYAVGSNERTTRLSGINADKVKMKVYMITGLLVAIASVAQLSRLGGMDVASAGNGYEMDSIAAVVVGGTAMSGGKGSILGTVLGVLIIGIMKNLLILLGVDSFLSDAFQGAIVVIAVLMQRKEKFS